MYSVEKFRTDLKRKRTVKTIQGMLTEPVWESYYDNTSDLFTAHGYQVFQDYLVNRGIEWGMTPLTDTKLLIREAMDKAANYLRQERAEAHEASLPKAYQTYKATIDKAFDMVSRDHGKTKQAIQLVDQAIQSLKGTDLELKYDSYAACANDYDNFIELMFNQLILSPDDAYHKLNDK